jgi:acid stress-induced BolA-like protein IbaG/YrbA
MTSAHVNKLTRELEKQFDAKVEAEKIGPKGRYRFAVVSPKFKKMTQLKRQDAIWAVVDKVLSRDATLDISLILAYAPEELEHAA